MCASFFYRHCQSNPSYVIKIASGFYDNLQLGLPSSNGCMLVFCQKTGQLQCVLLDEGHLTDVRTAVAGAIAAKYLAAKDIRRIGIVGTGIQARAQLEHLQSVVECRDALVWGRSKEKLDEYAGAMKKICPAFTVSSTLNIEDVQRNCNLIVTTTPSKAALLKNSYLQPGTHLTAVGSDTPDKQELEAAILQKADLVVADSISQCQLRGEISHAVKQNLIEVDSLVELGDIISGFASGRTSEQQITVADLTGVAVQDIQIASLITTGQEQ